MKISPPIDAVANELEAWALEVGWKAVGIAVAEQYHAGGSGDILPAVDSGDGLRNVTQRVKRIFRGFDGPRYAPQAEALREAALAALPTERRARLLRPHSPAYLVAVATKKFVDAINAINLGAAPTEILREADEANSAMRLAAMTAARAGISPRIGI